MVLPTNCEGACRWVRCQTLLYAAWMVTGLLSGVCIFLTFQDTSSPAISDYQKPAQTVQRPTLPANSQLSHNDRQLLFVGVMTADQFLNSRAVAAHDTWGQTVPGKLEFFTSEMSGGPPDLPIVRLKGVTDGYPPQKKSFMMFKHMYENYIGKYEWFMSADDEVYVRTDRLKKFLRGINSSQPIFIGHPLRDKTTEFGGSNLRTEDSYCMGGPGIVLSGTTLAKIYPHIRECLAGVDSTQEDLEVGRCVKKYTGVSCPWNHEMQKVFCHERNGTADFFNSPKLRQTLRAITLHPINVPALLHRVHNFFLSQQVQDAQYSKVERYRQVARCTESSETTQRGPTSAPQSQHRVARRLGQPPQLSRLEVREPAGVIAWSHVDTDIQLRVRSDRLDEPVAAPQLHAGIHDAICHMLDALISLAPVSEEEAKKGD